MQGQPPVDARARPQRPGQAHGNMKVQRWWSLDEAVEAGAKNLVTDEAEVASLLQAQLSKSVSLQSLADVPVGALLSGGVDSSIISCADATPVKPAGD